MSGTHRHGNHIKEGVLYPMLDRCLALFFAFQSNAINQRDGTSSGNVVGLVASTVERATVGPLTIPPPFQGVVGGPEFISIAREITSPKYPTPPERFVRFCELAATVEFDKNNSPYKRAYDQNLCTKCANFLKELRANGVLSSTDQKEFDMNCHL